MKKIIDPFDYAKEITHAIPRGVLLNTRAEGRFNTMTIGWGSLGTEWAKPIFTVYVRASRFTYAQLQKNPEFTVSIPLGECDRTLLARAGTLSGRDVDKQKELGLSLAEPEKISVPGILQLPLTLECRVLYQKEQALAEIRDDDKVKFFYPPEVSDIRAGRNNSPHTAFYGEIVAAYILEP